MQGDVALAADVQRLFAETKKAFGHVDILVNNAGVYSFSPLDEFTEEDFHRHFNINVLGLLQATREALKVFNPDGGSVINVGSAVTTVNPPNTVVYTATKGAVDSITAVLAKELAPRKIRVNSINPGGVETEGTVTAGVIGSEWEKYWSPILRSAASASPTTSPRRRVPRLGRLRLAHRRADHRVGRIALTLGARFSDPVV